MSEYYHDAITEASFRMLTLLNQRYSFVLIGGWAAYLYNGHGKSQDIDIVVDYATLDQLRNDFPQLVKNSRLAKYEIPGDQFDIDIYVPYFSGTLAIPPEYIQQHTLYLDGFEVPEIEILLALKLGAYADRTGTAKGSKDLIDIMGLLPHANLQRMKEMIIDSHSKHERSIYAALNDVKSHCTKAERLRFFGRD
jgi:hypothetical protein